MMQYVMQSPIKPKAAFSRVGITLLLLMSAFCVYIAPLVMPRDYNWLTNAISEAAAQGLQYAWLTRLGFLMFGLAVLWLVVYKRDTWSRGVSWMQLIFAVSMLGTAAFSHKPWIAAVPYDPFEDFLHSVTATSMGFAFAFGVIARLIQRSRNIRHQKVLDLVAIIAATVITPIGEYMPSIAGLLQRMMFAIAYLWFMYEALYPVHKLQRYNENTLMHDN